MKRCSSRRERRTSWIPVCEAGARAAAAVGDLDAIALVDSTLAIFHSLLRHFDEAAAFVPTNRLDLGRWHPDFVPLSFYKMFGYPTGVGCLLARKEALAKLEGDVMGGGGMMREDVNHLLALADAAAGRKANAEDDF